MHADRQEDQRRDHEIGLIRSQKSGRHVLQPQSLLQVFDQMPRPCAIRSTAVLLRFEFVTTIQYARTSSCRCPGTTACRPDQ